MREEYPFFQLSQHNNWSLLIADSLNLDKKSMAIVEIYAGLFPTCVDLVTREYSKFSGSECCLILIDNSCANDHDLGSTAYGGQYFWSSKEVEDSNGDDALDVHINGENSILMNIDGIRDFFNSSPDIYDASIHALTIMPTMMLDLMSWLVASENKTPLDIYYEDNTGQKLADTIKKIKSCDLSNDSFVSEEMVNQATLIQLLGIRDYVEEVNFVNNYKAIKG